MKAKIIPIITLLSLFSFLFYSCEDATYKEYKGYAPVYMSYKDLRADITGEQNVDLKNPGKIYFKDNYIFIVEELKGIHVFDNTDPSSPIKKVFVKLPGVVDISISGYIMYADSYVDLVVLDVENVDNIHEVGRIEDILPYMVPPAGTDFPSINIDKEKGVVIGWELRTIKEKIDNNPNPYPYPIYYDGGISFLYKSNASGASSGVSGSGVGIGGSMARFGIKGNVLYVVDMNTLKVFDITNKTTPSKVNDIYPGWNVETMFLAGNNMFLGTTTGMAIFDISNPTSPVWQTFFTHARSCDPVVVDDTLAYITLRTGTNCGGNLNCLDVVSIKNINLPKTVMSYFMTNPHGLGKDGDLLFICDGSAGLKVYDAADPKNIQDIALMSTIPVVK
ncbi:MAG: hypothetical protein NT144_12760 [Bacteroidia bacterium]|nr:hypothetical protein [Bacteroidia bacterium]